MESTVGNDGQSADVTGGPVLVTGASGFIGRYACGRWTKMGQAVRGLYRAEQAFVPPGVESCLVTGLHDREGLRAALEGVERVVHLAGRAHMMDAGSADALSEYRSVNVDGTRTLLAEAVRAGVTEFVFASSVKAMGERNSEPWTEAHRPKPVDPYGISKLEAEHLVDEATQRYDLKAASLRLSAVYGPGLKANLLHLFRAIDKGLPLPLAGVRNRRSFLFLENGFVAIDRVLATQTDRYGVYLVSDAHDVSTPELVREIARALGRNPRLVRIPVRLVSAAGKVGDLLSRVASLPLSSTQVDRLTESLTVDSTKLWQQLGTPPPVNLDHGLAETARWFKEWKLSGARGVA